MRREQKRELIPRKENNSRTQSCPRAPARVLAIVSWQSISTPLALPAVLPEPARISVGETADGSTFGVCRCGVCRCRHRGGDATEQREAPQQLAEGDRPAERDRGESDERDPRR